MRAFAIGAGVVFGLTGFAVSEDEKESKIALDKVPKAVLDAVSEEFPNAKLEVAETVDDDGETLYEVELKEAGRSIDVLLDDEGEIYEIEKEIAVGDLPKEVIGALNAKYPGAKIEEAEEVTEYEDDEEEADEEKTEKAEDEGEDGEEETYYEVEIVTADGKTLEVEVSADGKEVEAEANDDSDEKDDE